MSKKYLASGIAVMLVSIIGWLSIDLALAQTPPPPGGGGFNPPEQTGGGGGGNQTFPNPLGTSNYLDIIANIVRAVLGVVGVVALVVFIYGGIIWMTSLGNSERVRQGRDTLVWASLGLIVVFASFAIVNLILSAFDSAAG